MLNVSNDFKHNIANNSSVHIKGNLRLEDGTVREITGDDVMLDSLSITESTSSTEAFDIGSVIIGSLSVRLNNFDGRFDDYDFTNATFMPQIGVTTGSGIEWVRRGTYYVTQPDTYGTIINLSMEDVLSKLDAPYSEVTTVYPATLFNILQDICTYCDISLANNSFPNQAYLVRQRPTEEGMTCIKMVGYIAQLACSWVKMDYNGRLMLGWYNVEDNPSNLVDMTAVSDLTVYTDDCVITGVKVTAQDEIINGDEGDETGEPGESYLYGQDDYIIEITDNPLILYGQAESAANMIGPHVRGITFRPFDLSGIGSPAFEAGDPIKITDARGNVFRSFITSLTYSAGGYESFHCGAESMGRGVASSFSGLTRVMKRVREMVKREENARIRATDDINTRLDESSGLFMTTEEQSDGSYIYYAHDKPLLSESDIIWKFTAEAIGISTDGGDTYPYALDVDGTAILNRIYTIGLNADYINTGALVAKDSRGNTVFKVDVDTGEVYVNASKVSFTVSDTQEISLVDKLDDIESSTVTDVAYEWAQNYSTDTAPTSGWSSTQPTQTNDNVIWRRPIYTKGDGTTSTGTPEVASAPAGRDAVTVQIVSTCGTAFKNSAINTTLEASVFKGGQRIEDITTLRSVFGAAAYLQWSWRPMGADTFSIIGNADPRLTRSGFALTLTPEDVDVQAVFACDLNY